ncbi:PREDICTED: metallo-beta-lactamase domain-containing protein 2 [Nipponia nippon]|uniref:metallo-beta-lactamase domain-containing protein 2 n=1 Tax=Nipponia nippon TaxID=128390 RepID=UPI000510A357|nr:PREDICTED: metallo-beta-lactamase domain-containing protein 2 [Nipponia nippon]
MLALDWLLRKSLGGSLYWIQEHFYELGNRTNIWLLCGLQHDVVIDMGLGLCSLLTTSTSCENSRFGDPLAWTELHGAYIPACVPLPGCCFGDPPVGDVISLGDRQLTVMHMPGHSRGSICLHDKDRKILFSGDVVYDGSMIDWLPYSRVSDYVVSCQRLMELVDRGLVEKVLPGHFNIFGAERLYRLASNYISQAGVCHKVSTCAMRSIASIALRVTNSRVTS